MGLLGQAWLLLWTNIKLRQRRPILTIAQIAWPLLIFAVIAILRTSFPAKDVPECQYNARAVPSSGVLPFMQSMVCDLESSCVTDPVPSNEVPTLADAQIGQMLQDLDPVFQNDSVIDSIKALPETLAPITEFVEVIEDTVKNLTDIQPRVADLFHNVTKLRNALQNIGIPEEAVDAIFNATVDILEILNLVGSTNIGQACNETALRQFLTFPAATDVSKVSAALCNLTPDEVSTIIDQFLEKLDIHYIIDEIEQFLEAVKPHGLDKFVKDVEAIRDQLENFGDLGGLFESLPQLIQLTKLVPAIEFIIEEIQNDLTDRFFEELVSVIVRIDGYLKNIPWWQKFKQIVDFVLELIETLRNTEGDARDRGIKLVALIQNATRLTERLNITGDILEILLQSEIQPEQITLFLDLLENPEKAASVICSGNISQVITLPPDVDTDAATMFLCSFNITKVFEVIRDEKDLATLLDEFVKLLEQGSNIGNQTLDWEDVLNQTFWLIDEFNQIGEVPLSEILTDFLDTFANLDTSTLEDWLGLFISANATSGSAKNESGAILDTLLEPLITLLQAELAQTPLWLHIQKQLIIQSLSLDLQLQLLDTFASGSCPDNWHSHTPSCYQYSHDKVDFETSLEVCVSLHSFAHPVVINHKKEQEFLQTIGEDEASWLGLVIEGGSHFWLDGQEVIYTNWGNFEGASKCGVANFGGDGLWYSEMCTQTASNLCEAPQEHALVTLIKNSPMSDLSELMLKIGPNATEILLQEIFNPSTIEMLLSKDTNMTFELCSESFLVAVGSDLPDDILTQICAWDLGAFWESQMEYWKFPEIEQKISELVEISLTEPDEIPESYYPLADFEAIISKQSMFTEMVTAAAMVPLNLEALLTSIQPNIEVTGTPEEWQAVAERLNNYWYRQQLQQLMDQLAHLGNSTGLMEKFIYDFQQQLAIQEVANLIVQAGNTLFQIIEDLSKGIIGVNEPETQKLLMGIKKLLESSAQIQAAVGEVVGNPEKASQFFNALMQDNFFCNATLRDSVLDLKVKERQIFDDYICAVDYPVFLMEMVVLLDVPEIEKLIRFYIPYNASVDLLPFPDPVETQEIWAEYVNYLMNINEIRSQYIETYNLTKPEVLFPMPDFSNLTSSVNLLDMLEPILNAYDIDVNLEAFKFLQSAVEDLLTPGGHKDISLEDILQELNPLLNSSGINLKDLEELAAVIDNLLQKNISSDLRFLQILDELAPFINTTGLNLDGLKLLDVIVTNILSFDNDTKTSFLAILDELEPLLDAANINPDGLEMIRTIIENIANPNEHAEVSLMDLLEELEPYLNGSDINTDALKVLDLIISYLVPLENITDERLMDLIQKLEPYFNISGIDPEWMDVIGGALANMTVSLENATISDILHLLKVLRPFLNDSEINLDGLKLIDSIIRSINSLKSETDPNRLYESLGAVLSMFENSTWFQPTLRNMFISDLFTVALHDILTQSAGKVYTFPDDLGSLTNPDEIEQFIPIIYHSVDIIQVLFGISLDQEKITQLATSPEIIQTFCPNGSLDFFNTSFAQGVDLVSLQNDLCKVDLNAVITEVTSYPPLSMLITEVPYYLHQSPLPSFNWTAYFIHSEELNKAITDFMLDPLEVKVNPLWLNTTKTDLLQVLIEFEKSQNQAMLIQQLESLQTFLDVLHEEISPGVTWIRYIEDAVKILLGSVSYSNDILETLPGQNITFEDILPPYLAEYLTESFEYSGDINALFLHAAINVEELIAMSMTGDIFSVICTNVSSLEMLLDLPPEVNITAAQLIICSLNETAVNVEVMREVQKVLDKAQLDKAIDAMKASEVVEEFIKNVIELKHSPPNFSQFDDAWMETNARKWEAILKSLEAAQMMPTNLNDLGLEMLFEMLQETFKDDPKFQSWLIQLRMEEYFTVLFIEQAKDLVGKNISFQELNNFLREYPSLQDILSLREVIPEIVDILLALSTNPEKMEQFWNSSKPFQSVCMAGTFSYFFEVPMNSTTNLTSLESRLCGLNKTALLSEVDSLLGISEIQKEITKILTLDPSLPPLNFTAALFLRDLESQSVFSELFKNPPTVYFDEEFWQGTKMELQQVLSLWEEDLNKLLMPSNPLADLSSLLEVIEGQLLLFENETWYQSVLTNMRLMDYVNELITEWATDLQGKVLTLPRLEELFQNSPNIKKLLQLTDLTSDIIEAFLSLSLAPEKWTEFWTMENPIATLCASGEFTNFFELPDNSSSNITAVAKAVCSVNLTAVDIEFNKFLSLNEIGAEISQILYNSASLGPYNWTASFVLSMQVQKALQGLVDNPPIISVDPIWWNQTQTEITHVVGRWLKRVEETPIISPVAPNAMDIIETLLGELDAFKNESWYQDIVQQMRINDLINKLLISLATELQGKTLTLPTLEELFMNSTNIRELLEISAVAPDIIDAFLTLSLQPDKWESFWMMKDPIPTLCASGNFTSSFQLLQDSSSNITAVAEVICSLNFTAVGKEFSNLIKLGEFSSQLAAILYNHPSLGPYNWTASYILSMKASEAITNLILDPPVIKIDAIWWNQTLTDLEVVVSQWTSYLTNMTPGKVDNTSMEWLPEVINRLEEQLSVFKNESWYQDLITQMRVMDLMNELFIEWVTRFQGQTFTLPTLEELFENSTHVRHLLELTNLTPDLIDVLFSFSVQEEKWAAFLAMDNPIATLCASGNFTTFFQLPPDSPSNITAVAEAVCAVNITAVDRELKYLFKVDSISSQLSLILYNHPSLGPYNWTASYQLSQDVQRAIEDLVVNPPVFLVDPVWLNQTQTDLLGVIQQWWTRLIEMSTADPTGMDGFVALIEMLESQLSAFQDMKWYQDLITQMRLMDEVNRIIAQWINRLSGATVTIPHFNELFQNVTYIKELLELQNLTPELIDVFMSLSVSPEKWEMFWSMSKPIAELCASGNFSTFFVLPPNSMTDLMAVEEAVCSINITAVDKELGDLFGFDETFAKIALILANDPSLGPYNWTASYLLSMQLQEAITEFALYPLIIEIDDDWWNVTRSRLLDVLQQWGQHLGDMLAPSNPTGGIDINSIVEMISSSLTPLFENSEWYQDVIQSQRIMDEVNRIILHWAQELNGQTIILPHLDGLFENATHVREILALQDLTPEFIELLMSLSMKPEKFAEFFMMDKPFATLCMNSTFAKFFDLPSESNVNISELQRAVCSVNLTAAENELYYLLQLDSITVKFMQIFYNDPSLGPYNWTASVILSQKVQEAIAQLVTGPPVFKLDSQWLNNTLSALKYAFEKQMTQLGDMFGQTDPQQSLENGLQQLEMFLNQSGLWYKVQPVLEFITLYLDVYITQTEQNVEKWKVYLNITIPPDVAADLTSISADELKAYIISNFIPVTTLAYIHNNELWDIFFCNETVFEQNVYILYDEIINATALRILLCETNSTQLFQDLQGYYGFDVVQLQDKIGRIFSESPVNRDFDWQELIDLTQELTSLFEEIQKLPSFLHGSMNVSEIHGRLMALQTAIVEQNIETALTVLYELGPIFDPNSLGFDIRDLLDSINQQMASIEAWMGMIPSTNNTGTSAIELLQMIESSLEEYGVWNQVRPMIEITNLLLGSANEWLYPLGLSPSQVYYNASVLNEVLTRQIDDLSPALMETKAITDFIPLLQLANIYNNDLWEKTWQCGNYSEGFPDLGEATNVIEILCTLNVTEFFEEASSLVKVDILELEKQLSSLKYPSSGSNMTTIPLEWEELINNVQLFANAQREILYLVSSMGQTGSDSNAFSVIWQLIENMDVFENPMFGQLLQMLGSSMPIDDPIVRGYVPAITVLAELINAEFEAVQDHGINITTFFELQVGLMDLVQEILSESDLQAFLQAQINIEMLESIMSFEDVADMFCDEDQFNLLLTFPSSSEIDVGVIQRSLCDLIKSTNVTIQVGLYHYLRLGAIYQQAVKLYTNNYGAGFPQQDVDWEYTVGELEKVVYNFMNIQISREDWLTLLTQFSGNELPQLPMPGSTEQMLNQIFHQLDVILVNNTMWLEVKGYIAAVTDLAESINAEFVEFRELGINATTFIELQTELMAVIQEILSENELEALLQANIDEEMLGNIKTFEDVADIVCDEDQFNLLLTFPSSSEVDVGVIQRSLCDLVKSSNVTIQLGLYHYLRLGAIYQQVIRLYTSNHFKGFPPTEVDLMETLIELNLLVANFMSIDLTQVWHALMEVAMDGDWYDGFPLMPITNMTFSPTSICEVVVPLASPVLFGGAGESVLIKTDLFFQVINELYFDLPDHEEEIQSLLNNQTLVGELMWTAFSVSSDAMTALQGISKDMGQIYLLRALFLDVIEGNLHDVACSEQDLRNLLNLSPLDDVSDLSSLICSLDAIVQTELVQELLVIIDFESAANKIRIIDGPAFGNLPPLSCSSLIDNGEEFVGNMLVLLKDPTAFKLELEIPGLVDLAEDITSIITNLTSGDYSSLQPLVELLDEFVEGDFLGENGTARLVIDELLQLYDSYIDAINRVPGVIPVNSTWWNSSEVASLLLEETGLMADDVIMLMEGSINSTVIAEITNLTVFNWGKLVCDEDVFMRLLILSSDELENLVYQETCQHPNKEMLFDEISQSFNLFKFLVEMSQSAIPVPTFTEFLEEILSNIKNFEKLNSTVVEDFLVNVLPLLEEVDNVSDLVDFIPLLENLTLVLDSFDELFDNLKPVLGETPEFQKAKALFELLKENQYIVDVLKEFPDLTVKKMLKYPDAVRFFLEEEIGLASEIVDYIFNAQLNPEMLLTVNITDSLGSICSEETFNKYLDFVQGTDPAVVVDGVCSQNVSTVGEVLSLLFSSFNTDGTIDALASLDIVEAITNMTDSFQNITQSLEEIQQLQDTIPTLLESADSLGQIFDEEMLEELNRGEISAFTLLQENSDLFCGNGESSRRRRRRQTFGNPSASSGFCQDLYSSLQSGSFGELQWAFVKPILLGKILYTPVSPASEKIIKKANKPFEDLTEISEVAQSWLRGVTELTNLLESSGLEEIENLLGNAYISQLLETELAIDADSLMTVLQGNLTSISVEALNQITVLAELVVNVTSCLELDRFVGFESEAEMEEYATPLNMDNLFLAGISFRDLEGAIDVPRHVKYALRMDTDKTPSTEVLTDIYWRPGPRGDFFTQQQYLQGFVFLQDMIERAVIELHATSDQLSDVYIQQMPYPCYRNDRYLFIASIIFPLLFTIGFLILIAVMTHQLVYEKERGIEELMKVMGLRGGINWFAWFFSNAVLLTVLMVIIAIILQIASIVQSTQISVLIVFLLCFAFSLIMQSYMVSSFFQKANVASLGALLVYLLLYVPYGFVFTRGGEVSVIGSLAVSLASPSAFSFGCLVISRFEHQGIGVSWETIWENPRDEDHSSLAASCIMMVVDGFIYFIIGWYIRTVFPGKFGVPRPWYFPFQPSYWFRGIRSDTDTSSTPGGAVNEGYQEEGATPMTEMGTQVESEPMHAPVGIAIQNLSKVYGTKCPSVENRALDKMTLNFFEGQVTALLGSNGAGKTTVISIITGLYPASDGSVNIYGQKIGFNAGVRGSDLGLCPQHNALYDELTVREHLKIYGKLKGMSKKALREQSSMLLDELHLLDMINVPIYKLSGGMKRKLCVAISLMGNSKTVILDEPTSGVDPHARRAVWDLIIRSKKDRTIVLCTHFMDEADLLGDRIAILDRGQLRCCGSSAFLKSKFTSGVKLTLSKERPSGSSTPQSSKKLAIGEGEGTAKGNDYQDLPVTTAKEAREEDEADRASSSSSSGVSSQRELCDSAKVTQFLTSRVDGITLLKEVGSELVYQLPSTKEERAKFPQLFRDLDDQLAALHIRNYGVSDTNLEEVFLKVSTHSDSFMESNVDQSGDITEDPPKWNKNQNGQRDEVIFGGQLTNAFQQVRGILLKRFHITRRDWRGFIWAVLMPVAMLALGTVMTELYPVPMFPPLQLTPAMFKDPNYIFFSNGETSSVIGERLTKAFLNAPGIGTTCMSDADELDLYPCELGEAFFPEPISGLTDDEKRAILEEDLQSPLCVCEDGISVCDEEAGGVPPPVWITNTSAILQDLSLKMDVTEYLLNTRHLYEQNSEPISNDPITND